MGDKIRKKYPGETNNSTHDDAIRPKVGKRLESEYLRQDVGTGEWVRENRWMNFIPHFLKRTQESETKKAGRADQVVAITFSTTGDFYLFQESKRVRQRMFKDLQRWRNSSCWMTILFQWMAKSDLAITDPLTITTSKIMWQVSLLIINLNYIFYFMIHFIYL